MPHSFLLSIHRENSGKGLVVAPRKLGNAFSELYRRHGKELDQVRSEVNNTEQTDWPIHFPKVASNVAQGPAVNPIKNRLENHLTSLEFFRQSEATVYEGSPVNNALDVLDLLRRDMEQSYQNVEYLLRTDSPYPPASLTQDGAAWQSPSGQIEQTGSPEWPVGAGPENFAQYNKEDKVASHNYKQHAGTNEARAGSATGPVVENDRNTADAKKDSKMRDLGAESSEGNPKEKDEKLNSAPKSEKSTKNVIPLKEPKNQEGLGTLKRNEEKVSQRTGNASRQGASRGGESNQEGQGIRIEVIDERRVAQEPVEAENGKAEDGKAENGGKSGNKSGSTLRQRDLAKAAPDLQTGQARQTEPKLGQTPVSDPVREGVEGTTLREPSQDSVARLASGLRGESSLLQSALQAKETLKEIESAQENLAGKEVKAPLEKETQTAQRFILQPASAQRGFTTRGFLGASLRGRELRQVASLRKRQSQGIQHWTAENSAKGTFSESGFSELRLSEGVPQSGAEAKNPGSSGQVTVLRSFVQQMVQRLQEGPLAQNLRQLQFRLLEHNRGEIRLRLSPEHLGQLRIHLSVEGSQLSGRIMAESAEAVRILQDHLPQLQESLREGGFSGLNVSVGGGQENQQGSAPYGSFRAASGLRMATDQNEEWEDLAPIWQLEQNQIDYSA